MNSIRIRALITTICLSATCTFAIAQEPQTELLWPDGAPGAVGDEAKDKPTLIIYQAEKSTANGTAIIVTPGGGYGHLAMDHEGHQIGRWLNSIGISAFICDYRHRGKGYGHPAPMDDAQRAIRIVRARAAEFGVRPDRIGVLGFSAGGHLASTVSTHFVEADAKAVDPMQRVSSRPDFAVLCYPVIALGEDITHKGSQKNLFGKDPDADLARKFSNEKQVTENNPPTFLWHTLEDNAVPVENSVRFFIALKNAGVPAELHVYEKGRHGLGLAAGKPGAENWPTELTAWLNGHGLLKLPQ